MPKTHRSTKNLRDHLKKDLEIEGDDIPKIEALEEAAREHQDTYMIASDLEDSEQRSIVGTREQP